MTELYLTAYDGSFLGPIARLLGWIMDKIYIFFSEVCGIESVGLTIIIFTVFIYLCLFPLTYKQQKFSVLSRKMQPELNAVQEKYKGKVDNESRMAMQEETSAIYDKYGISPMGSCVQLLIQMPILFALYRVFYNTPAYITSLKSIFTNLVDSIMSTEGYQSLMQGVYEASKIRDVRPDFLNENTTKVADSIIDVLYKLPASGWDNVKSAFPDLVSSIDQVITKLEHINYIFVLNISENPWNLIKNGWDVKDFVLIICALLVPVCAYLGQLLSIKLIPQADSTNDQMAQQMKTMNTMMPLMSLFIAFSVPVGLGVYWTVSALVRAAQQFILNKHFEKINLDDIIAANKEKARKKAEKRGIRNAQIYEAAKLSTKNADSSSMKVKVDNTKALEDAAAIKSAARPGSLAAKANKVKEFNEKNNR